MKIEQLQQLLKIVEKGSMNEAAKALFLSRSTLSASMKCLESELGGEIFSRHSKGVRLTPFGTSVYRQACEICTRAAFLVQLSHDREKRSLSIASMYCSMANDVFADLLREHTRDRLDASIEETSLENVIRQTAGGLCDIGIITLFSDSETVTLRRLEDEGLEYHELAQRVLGAIVGPKHPLYNCAESSIKLQTLCEYPHLENYSTPTDHSWEHRLVPLDGYRASYLVSDLGLALRIVMETDAIMIDTNDSESYRSLYTQHDYKFIPIQDYPKCKTGWIKCKDTPLSPIAQTYLNLLTEKARRAN